MTGISWITLAAVAAAPWIAERLRRPMTRERQQAAPGCIARLAEGRTHYRWSGAETGPVAICIHGLSTPSYIFAGTERSLAALGYRVLTYDLFGRGYSDRVPGRQDLDFFVVHLRGLIDHLDVSVPLTVIGYSMGGAIATVFAAQEGARVRDLVLMAPAGLLPVYDTLADRIWTAPVLGDWLMPVAGAWALRRELSRSRNRATIIPDLDERQLAETRTRGFLPALLSARRNALREVLDDDHKAIRARGTRVLAIWGEQDDVIRARALSRLSELNPDAHHHQIAGAGHEFPQTHPAEVGEALREFLG